jgi:hypothetical protein
MCRTLDVANAWFLHNLGIAETVVPMAGTPGEQCGTLSLRLSEELNQTKENEADTKDLKRFGYRKNRMDGSQLHVD